MQDLQVSQVHVVQPNSTHSVINRFATIYLLTNREAEIIGLIALHGYSNKEIADHCTISEKTVKVHIDKIMVKVGTRSMRKLLALIICTTI
ncbi:helix-turn-helix transcriptional regulator [Paenibacillus sp. SYP-B3998]|uniref:Helix-turn-helix transcriptional regulator n=1 Tax=Paenibacillus sp. SYP-B3998 TaxID=2678564 RepID=A0A6G4A0U5_9BACL|nr:helix-turn-helix transcriptional regulator [Paenibacillus sp. SYP-B3998]NEW08012.1 helix-turn-helix transcriptional regulator [Paenibacillus sp. SYP-B3998]